ncbi:MAG TPA: hypothetical protein VD973_06590 [Symbiobacteriaceae bacterium]|nr:hypothetical protein [Symbiobacteriaceae bacterium]
MAVANVALYKLLEEVTGDLDFFRDFEGDYRKRLIAQKLVYLLQSHMDSKKGWAFNWYVAGPYSPALARELFSIAEHREELAEQARKARFTETAAAKVHHLQQYVKFDYASLGLDLAGWLELLGSVVYVAQWKQIPLGAEPLGGEVKKVKPKFTVGQIKEAISFLQER